MNPNDSFLPDAQAALKPIQAHPVSRSSERHSPSFILYPDVIGSPPQFRPESLSQRMHDHRPGHGCGWPNEQRS